MSPRNHGRITLIELATLLVALVVVAAIAIPLWRSHRLDVRREEARGALAALQKAQDAYFGAHARYADRSALHAGPPHGLGLTSTKGRYQLDVETSADALSYVATALSNTAEDARCRELRIDHLGRRTASDDEGRDTSADCWNRR